MYARENGIKNEILMWFQCLLSLFYPNNGNNKYLCKILYTISTDEIKNDSMVLLPIEYVLLIHLPNSYKKRVIALNSIYSWFKCLLRFDMNDFECLNSVANGEWRHLRLSLTLWYQWAKNCFRLLRGTEHKTCLASNLSHHMNSHGNGGGQMQQHRKYR